MSEPRRKLSISVPRVPWIEAPNRMNDDFPRRDLSDSKGRDNFVKDDTRPPVDSPQTASEGVRKYLNPFQNCPECGNAPDTPMHELGCELGRAELETR